MIPIEMTLRLRFGQAMAAAFGPEHSSDPQIKIGDPKFADYQCNAAMALARLVSRPPREVAARILEHLSIDDMCEPPQIAGPGFINLRLKAAWLAAELKKLAANSMDMNRGGVDPVGAAITVVVDYAGPNIAKEMHVGHLRSAIIGDSIARTLGFLGHTVIRQNHVGDFGTQFGMLIRHAKDAAIQGGQAHISDLDAYYKQASQRDKDDPQFAIEARQAVVALQNGDPQATRLWHWIRDESRRHCRELFLLLGVGLSEADERGESFYKDRLAPMVERLKGAMAYGGDGPRVGLDEVYHPAHEKRMDVTAIPDSDGPQAKGAMESVEAADRVAEAPEPQVVHKPFLADSQGALCVFLPGYVDKEKKPLPLIIRKSDGAFLYATTDLAALYFRIQEDKLSPPDQAPLGSNWHAQRIIYATDARQAQHFAMVFDTIRAAHWDMNPQTGLPVKLEHAPFGSILGEDGKPFKTRSGESVKLRELLNEAIERAARVVAEKNPNLPAQRREIIARAVGIGAVKYADLRQDRTGDYAFAWERMLSFEGNTGPYLQYTYTRICSIFRKAAEAAPEGQAGSMAQQLAAADIILDQASEKALARRLCQFGGVVESAARDLKPHYICGFLYDLAGEFSSFYEACPVLKAASDASRHSRLLLCRLTQAVLAVGLRDLLGIELLEEM